MRMEFRIFFSLFRTAFSTAALVSEIVFDGFHGRLFFENELSSLFLTYHCLCLEDRRGRFGRNYRCSSFGGHSAYIHYLFQRMLLTCGVWGVYVFLIACASWMERLYVWEARGFTSTSLLHLHKSLFVPFSVLFLDQVIFPWFYGCLCVCCMYVCVCVVWWGSSLSFSLDRRGDGGSMAGQQRRWRGAVASLQLRRCWGIGRSHRRSGRKVSTVISYLSCTLYDHAS